MPSWIAAPAALVAIGITGALAAGPSHSALAAAKASAPPARPSAMRGWSLVRTPRLKGGGQLQAVSCATSRECVAVGVAAHDIGRSAGSVGIVERWDGSRWSVVRSPLLGGTLLGISCPTRGDCMAVGLAGAQASGVGGRVLAERWDGSRWSRVSAPTPKAGGALAAVSCASPSDCTAVGQSVLQADLAPFRSRVIVEHWDGAHWSLVATPAVHGGPGLDGIACVSSSLCVAVGSRQRGPVLVERWNGTRWSPASPQPFHGGGELQGVSCPSASDCIAVGRRWDGPVLVEHWNGANWSIMHTPPIPGDSGLAAVSCKSKSDCTAAGASGLNSDRSAVLIEHWNGASWSIVSAPTVAGGTELYGVSCTGRGACTAVGQSGDDGPGAFPLAEHQP